MIRKALVLLTIVLLNITACVSPLQAVSKVKSAQQLESATYDVYFHMGFIWAKAGRGNLTMSKEVGVDGQERLHGQLAAKSLSVVEHIMQVRDTLDCYFTPSYVPIEFCKKTNEGSYKAVERNYYTSFYKQGVAATPANVDSTKVEIRRWRNKKGNQSKDYSAQAPAYDMLSAFYAIRQLDFAKMEKDTKKKFLVFSGVKMQWMTVQYRGQQKCTLRNGKKYDAYSILLYFSTKDADSQPLEVWLSADSKKQPVKAVIALSRVGSVQCELTESR